MAEGPPTGFAARRAGAGRLRVPDSKPPGLNYAVLTGTLAAAPRPGRSPAGDPVFFARLEYPVADPERPELLHSWASCEVEVPQALAERHGIGELAGGTSLLVAGQLGERWAICGGRTARRAVIVAILAQPGPLPEEDALIVSEYPPEAPGSS